MFEFLQDPRWAGLDLPTKKAILGNSFNEDLKPDIDLEFIKDPRWEGFDSQTKKSILRATYERDVQPRIASLEPAAQVEILKSYLNEAYQTEQAQQIKAAPERRGTLGRAASGLARGTVETIGRAGSILELADLQPKEADTDESFLDVAGRGITDWSQRVLQEYEFLKKDKGELLGEPGLVKRGLVGGAESIPQSLPIMATAWAGAKAGAAVGGGIGGAPGAGAGAVIGGVGGAIAGLVAFFGAGTYGDEYTSAYEELKRTRPEATEEEVQEVAHRLAFRSAAFEVTTEIPGTLLGLRMLGGTKVLTEPLKATLRNILSQPLPEFTKKFAAAAAGEISGEMVAGGGQAWSRQAEGLSGPTISEGIKESIIPSIVMSLFFGAAAAGYNRTQSRSMMNQLNSEDIAAREAAIDTMAYRINANTQDPELALAWRAQALDFAKSGERFDFDEKVIEFAKIKTAEEYKGSELKQVDTTDYGITDAPDIDEAVDRFNQALEQPPEERELTELESRRQDVGLTLPELAELPIDQAQDLLLKGREATTELYPGLQAEYTGPKGKQRILLVEQNEDESWKARSLADGLELTAKPDRIVPVPALEPGREIEYQTKKGLMRGALIEPLGETAWRARDDKGKPFVALADKISPVAIKGEQTIRPRVPKIESLLSEIDRLTERTKFAGPSRDAAIKKQAKLAEGVVENVKPGDIVTDRDGEQLGVIDKIDDKSVALAPDNINPKGISFPVKDFIGLFVPDKTGAHASVQTKEATYAGTVRGDAGQVLPGAIGALEKNAQREGAPEGDQGEALRQRAGEGGENLREQDRQESKRELERDNAYVSGIIERITRNPESFSDAIGFHPRTKKLTGKIDVPSWALMGTSSLPTSESGLFDSSPDGISAAMKFVGNLPGAKTFQDKGFDGLNVNTKRLVYAGVRTALHDDNVFRRVVESVPVEVVDNLTGKKFSTQDLLRNKDVFLKSLPTNPNDSVSSFVGSVINTLDMFIHKTPFVGKARNITQQASQELKSQIDEAAHEAATSPLNELPEPTDPQKIAGNAKLGHIPGSLIGLPRWKVSVENPKDSIRTQAKPKDAPEDWKPGWSTKMTAHYGYFVSNQAGLESPQGKDKDKVDVYIGDQPEAKTAFIVDQINPETKKFDEHKVITSVIGEEAAKDLYNSNYSKGWKGLGAITEVSLEELDAWLGSEGRKTEPIAYGKDVARETTGLQPIVWKARKSMGMSFYSTPIEGDTLVIRENPSGKNRFTVYKKSDGPVKNIGKFATLEAAKEAGATIIPEIPLAVTQPVVVTEQVHEETLRAFDKHLAEKSISPETHAAVKDVVSILKEHELKIPIIFNKDATHSTDGKRKINLDLNSPVDVSFLREYAPNDFTEEKLNELRQKNALVRIYGEYSNNRSNGPEDRGTIVLYDGANPADTYEELIHALQAAGIVDPGPTPKGVSQSAHEEAHAKQIVKDLLAGKELPNVRKRKVSGEVKDAGKKAEPPSSGTGQRSIRTKGGAREHAFTKTPAGHEVTAPAISYSRGVDNKGNVWVRQSGAESNDGRQLLVQFSTELINKNAVIDESSRYYDALYSGTRKGYQRLRDFWEIPQWMGYVSKYLPNTDVYVVRDMAEARQFLDKAGYDRIILSAIDVNKDLIKTLAGGFNGHVDIGGYTTPGTFDDLPNAKWHDTLESLATDIKVPFSEGVDYRHFEGAKVIPRLTMSQGCLHKCAFCIVPKTLVQTSNEIVDQQAEAFGVLDAQLVYLNDKTFGQAKNYTHLENVYQAMLKNNPDFKGFIIQTTGTQLLKMDAAWLKRSGIKYVELGVETYNDAILRSLKKPHNEAILDRAAQKLREANIAMIPNIIVGLPDETAETYQRTLDFIERNADIISHENIYNLALYEGSELATRLEATSASDVDENVLEKSFHKDEAIHKGFSQKVFAMGMRGLEEGRAPQGIQYPIRDASRIQAGPKVKLGSTLYHVANPFNRESILQKGLLPKRGGQLIGVKRGYIPAIYLTNSTDIKDSFDSTYDDDIYKISTEGLSGDFYRDLNFDNTSKHVLTFDKIPVENITLVYRGTGKDKDSIREGVKKGQFSIREAKSGTVIPWREFGRYLERLPLSDTFGKLSLKERRALAAAGESWKLTAIDPITLKEVSPVGVKTKFPVIIAEGNVIDGVRRINAAIANKDKAILAWVAQDKPELPAKIPTATIYQMVQEIHRNYDDFIEGDLGDRLDKYSYYQLQSIALKDLDLDEWQVHESLVADIKKQIQGASQYPPIVVGADMSIIDGIHRANALRELGYSKVQAYVGLQDRRPEDTQYAIRADTRKEMAEIKRAAKKAKSYLKAPDGSPTLLDPDQWAIVRTSAFKNWFGDWEKGNIWGRGDVSKVVGKNGEPLVVYHGTKKGGFSLIDPSKRDKPWEDATFFTDNVGMAATYSGTRQETALPIPKTKEDLESLGWEFDQKDDYVDIYNPEGYLYDEAPDMKQAIAITLKEQKNLPAGTEPGIYPVFLNIRDPYETDFEGANWNGDRIGQYIVTKDGEQQYDDDDRAYFDEDAADEFASKIDGEVEEAPEHYEDTRSAIKTASTDKNDGAIIRNVTDMGEHDRFYDYTPSDVFAIFKPEQAKSATWNLGTFDPSNPDLRYSIRDTFYSKLTKEAESQDLPAKAQGVIPYLLKKGVKPTELEWMGVEQWVKENQKDGKIDRGAFRIFLAQNQIEMEEVTKGESRDDGYLVRNKKTGDTEFYSKEVFPTREEFEDWLEDNSDYGLAETDETKFAQWQIPGGTNYREMLFVSSAKSPEYWTWIKEIERLTEKYGGPDFFVNGKITPEENKHLVKLHRDAGYGSGVVYKSSHWEEPNVLGHVRMNDRDALTYTQEQIKDIGQRLAKLVNTKEKNLGSGAPLRGIRDGIITPLEAAQYAHAKGFTNYMEYEELPEEKILNLEEVQSDWHQEGKKTGYNRILTTDENLERRKLRSKVTNGTATDSEYARWQQLQGVEEKSGVPLAPFAENWHEVFMKRMLRYAVENGYTKMTLSTGQIQFERWGSEEIAWEHSGKGWQVYVSEQVGGQAGDVNIENEARIRGLLQEKRTWINTKEQLHRLVSETFRGHTKPEVDKAVNRAWNRMQTENIGTSLPRKEGLEFFYDKLIPGFLNKYLKQWNGKVEKGEIDTKEESATPWALIDATDEGGQQVLDRFATETEARKALDEYEGGVDVIKIPVGKIPVWEVKITPEMRAGLQKPQPLFSIREADQKYLAAVESGDMETAQKMVDVAAIRAGYTVAAAHGTDIAKIFNRFQRRPGDIGMHFGTEGQARDRLDYLRSRTHKIPGPSPRILKVYLNLRNPLRLQDPGMWKPGNVEPELMEAFPEDLDEIRRLRTPKDARLFIQSQGYDGIIYRNTGETRGAHELQIKRDEAWDNYIKSQKRGRWDPSIQPPEYKIFQDASDAVLRYREENAEDSYIVFERKQIKSSDPVTYDDKGNVIPLSRRFKASPDIRYAARKAEQPPLQVTVETIHGKYAALLLADRKKMHKEIRTGVLTDSVIKTLGLSFGVKVTNVIDGPGLWFNPETKEIEKNPAFSTALSVPPGQIQKETASRIRGIAATLGLATRQEAVGFIHPVPLDPLSEPIGGPILNVDLGRTISYEQAEALSSEMAKVLPAATTFLVPTATGVIITMPGAPYPMSYEDFTKKALQSLDKSIKNDVKGWRAFGKEPFEGGDYYESSGIHRPDEQGVPSFERAIRNSGGPRSVARAYKFLAKIDEIKERYRRPDRQPKRLAEGEVRYSVRLSPEDQERVLREIEKDPAIGAPVDFKNKAVTLTHWSKYPSLTITDPSKHGTGNAGAELKAKRAFPALWIPKTYVGYGKYIREPGLGSYRYGIDINGNSLYDAWEDPLGLFPTADETRAMGFYTRAAQGLIHEQRIKDAGFRAYVSTPYSVAALFEPVEVYLAESGDQSLPQPVEDQAVSFSVRPPDTPEFKKWFTGSRVVDENGKPLVVYHGTIGDFSKFKKSEEGIFFTTKPSIAEVYTRIDENSSALEEGANIVPVYLSIKNPLVITPIEYLNGKTETGKDIGDQEAIEGEGYDGIRIISNTKYGPEWSADTWIAFEPNQIKSATGNRGTFDANNPDIRYSMREVSDNLDSDVHFAIRNVYRELNMPSGEGVIANRLSRKGTNAEITIRAAQAMLTWPKVITDPEGKKILLHNPERQAGVTRFDHLTKTKTSGYTELDMDKVEWLSATPDTLAQADVKILNNKTRNIIYVRAYDKGAKHLVVTDPNGLIREQGLYDAGLVTQYKEREATIGNFPVLWSRSGGLETPQSALVPLPNKLRASGQQPGAYDESMLPEEPDVVKTKFAIRPPVVFAETTTPVVPQDYIENRVEAQAKGKILGTGIKMAGAELGAEVSKLMAPISTRLKYINPALSAKLRRLDFETNQAIQRDRATVLPLLRKAKGMSPGDLLDWDYARKNSDIVKINELVNRYNMQAEYAAVRAMFDDLRDAAIDVGLDIGEIDEYWTRKVVDLKGLYEEMNREELGIFSKALAEKAASLGLQVYELDPDMRATLITNVILGGPTGVGGVSAAKERKFLKIPPRLNKYYMNSDAAVLEHISAMRTAIEKRKFFGKIPEKVAEMRRQLYVAQAKVREYQHLYRTEPDPIKKDKARVKRNEWIGEEKQLTAYIQKYALQRDYTDNIGAFIDEMIVSGDLKPSDESDVKEILQARFHERGAHGFWSLYKNFSYIDTMGSPISALTQIGDLAWAMYEGGMISGLKHAGKSLAGTSKITRADVGIERIAEEFADNTKLGAALTWVFKHTGLEKMDAIGKEALLNATLEKQQKLARENPQELANKIQHIFGNETTDTIDALQNDIITENVKMLVYSRLVDFQPVGLSEMPQRYLTSGNGRIFYMLKTFTLKQFDVFRNEAIHKITSGSRSEKIEGLKNLMRLAMLFVLANATADELKDFVLGRQTDFSDRVADNILRLTGSSKFVTWTARSEGLVSAFAKQVLPPFKFVDSLSKDIYNAGDDKGLELTASIPLIGKLAYWHLGRGTTKRHELWDVRLRKYKANLTEVHEDLEKAVDKVAYRKEHSVELARYREVNNFQGRLNNYRKIINNLKSRPEQTDAIQKRIEQLETRRTESIKQFLEKKETQNEER